MANDIPTSLAQYQQADFNERLNLYLQYPALRAQFMAIASMRLTVGFNDAMAGFSIRWRPV